MKEEPAKTCVLNKLDAIPVSAKIAIFQQSKMHNYLRVNMDVQSYSTSKDVEARICCKIFDNG